MLAQAGDRRRRIEHNLSAVQAQRAGAFRKVAVVTDVHADPCESEVEDRIAKVARTEIKLLPKTGRDVRYVRLAILPEVLSGSVDHSRGVVIYPLLLDFVNRHDQGHAMPARQLLHALYRGPVGDRLGEIVPARLLLRAKIRAVKNLLEARDLRPGLSGQRDEIGRASCRERGED